MRRCVTRVVQVINVNGSLPVRDVTAAVEREFQSKIVFLSGGVHSQLKEVGAALADSYSYVYIDAPTLINAEIALASTAGQRLERMVKVRAVVPRDCSVHG